MRKRELLIAVVPLLVGCGGRVVGPDASGATANGGADGAQTLDGAGGSSGDEPASSGAGGTFVVGTHPAGNGDVGGYGFILRELSQKCAWDPAVSDAVVFAVPTIERPEYYTCLTVSGDFALCLDDSPSTCGTIVPPECESARAALDACW